MGNTDNLVVRQLVDGTWWVDYPGFRSRQFVGANLHDAKAVLRVWGDFERTRFVPYDAGNTAGVA